MIQDLPKKVLMDQRWYARAGVSYPTLEPDTHSGIGLASLISASPTAKTSAYKVLVVGSFQWAFAPPLNTLSRTVIIDGGGRASRP